MWLSCGGGAQVALAVCAECEAAVLQLDDFEEIITYLKVPIQTLALMSPNLPFCLTVL